MNFYELSLDVDLECFNIKVSMCVRYDKHWIALPNVRVMVDMLHWVWSDGLDGDEWFGAFISAGEYEFNMCWW